MRDLNSSAIVVARRPVSTAGERYLAGEELGTVADVIDLWGDQQFGRQRLRQMISVGLVELSAATPKPVEPEPDGDDALTKMSRDELNEHALGVDIESPEKYRTKADLIAAIRDASGDDGDDELRDRS